MAVLQIGSGFAQTATADLNFSPNSNKMNSKIQLPYGPKMGTCYETLQQTTPDLYDSFMAKVLGATQKVGLAPGAKLKEMLDCADEVYAAYLRHDNSQQMAIHSSWQCCVADLADALVEQSIEEISDSKLAKKEKAQAFNNLLETVTTRLTEAPNQLMMRLSINGALGELEE